jgi:hypothetical protein
MLHLDRPTGRDASGLLDRTMPVWLCALILVAISILPVWYVAGHYSPEHGFTELILFGKQQQVAELPEVKAQHPATLSEFGYDGQFYAQLAMDPTMRRPDLRVAVPQINYRSDRYLPMLLSYLCGFGQPRAILTAYVLLNIVFWFGLVALMAAYLRGRCRRTSARSCNARDSCRWPSPPPSPSISTCVTRSAPCSARETTRAGRSCTWRTPR